MACSHAAAALRAHDVRGVLRPAAEARLLVLPQALWRERGVQVPGGPAASADCRRGPQVRAGASSTAAVSSFWAAPTPACHCPHTARAVHTVVAAWVLAALPSRAACCWRMRRCRCTGSGAPRSRRCCGAWCGCATMSRTPSAWCAAGVPADHPSSSPCIYVPASFGACSLRPCLARHDGVLMHNARAGVLAVARRAQAGLQGAGRAEPAAAPRLAHRRQAQGAGAHRPWLPLPGVAACPAKVHVPSRGCGLQQSKVWLLGSVQCI